MRAFISIFKAASGPAARTVLRRATSTPQLTLLHKVSRRPQRGTHHRYTESIASKAYSTTHSPKSSSLPDEDQRSKRKEDEPVNNTAGDGPIDLLIRPNDFKQKQRRLPEESEGSGGKDGSKGGGGEDSGDLGGEEDFDSPGLEDFLPDSLDFF